MAQRDNEMPEYLRSARLIEEAEQTLRAIQHGAVDAFVVEESDGHRVYTLEGADLPYSTLVERMQQGAAILDANGCIVYCNLSLAGLLNLPREGVINRYLHEFVDSADRSSYQKLLQESKTGSSEGEVHLPLADGSLRSASFSFSLLSREKTATGVLITDLTPQKQQMEFASRLQNMQDEERRRIARELHDSVGQLLAAIGMNMEIVRAQSDKLDAKAQRAFNDNAMMVEQVSSEIRTISHLLHPPLLDLAGLASALRWYVDGFSTRSNIKVDLEIPETLGRLPAEMEIAIFRMVQECLTNIHRHSGSSTATISLSQEGERVLVQVRDMGRGIPLEKQRDLIEAGRGGVGLGGMRERLRQLGGTLEIKSGETGTTIIATLIVA
jgi:PAS domain S-box-containing protein